MKKRWVIPSVLLVLFLGVLTPQHAQEIPAGTEKSDRTRRQFAVSLLRTINTAEVVDKTKLGSYSSWKTLLAHHSEYFDQFVASHGLSKTGFADMPEISPGWNLRMNAHADGQGYDVLLRDMTDEKCGYAAVTDENGVIRQSKTINCEI